MRNKTVPFRRKKTKSKVDDDAKALVEGTAQQMEELSSIAGEIVKVADSLQNTIQKICSDQALVSNDQKSTAKSSKWRKKFRSLVKRHKELKNGDEPSTSSANIEKRSRVIKVGIMDSGEEIDPILYQSYVQFAAVYVSDIINSCAPIIESDSFYSCTF